MNKRKLTILHLYPDRMNIYGDYGNILALQSRMKWRDIDCNYITHEVGDNLTQESDIIFMGGGQDSGQLMVAKDLVKNREYIQERFLSKKPILTICGGYQLFGHSFTTAEGIKIKGIGIFDTVTVATNTRMIGNIVVRSKKFGTLVGFENHSGATTLLNGSAALGEVITGYGNNQNREDEGILVSNAIGTYMHGSFLPKNPKVTDFLIKQALRRKGLNDNLKKLDDNLEQDTRKWILNNLR